MTGSHHVVVETTRLKYEFTIRRNLTILQGDSATGKTTLVDMLRDFARGEEASAVRVESDVPCVVYGAQESDWHQLIPAYTGSLVFIDEDYHFIHTKEFADAIRQTDNYYILITREPLLNLPYSVREIYGIRTSGRFHFPQQIYHEFYPIYEQAEFPVDVSTTASYIVTEDEAAGYLFLRSCCEGMAECIAAKGNANIYSVLKELPRAREVVVIADGAAFGAFVEKLLALSRYRKDAMIYLPESFEWIILKSGVVRDEKLKDVMEAPETYIDSARYFSWEQFFTDYLESATVNDALLRYKKNHLPEYYLKGKVREKILAVFPEGVRSILESGGT